MSTYYQGNISVTINGRELIKEYLQSLNSRLSIGDCKGILGRLSLRKTPVGDPTMTRIENLSGGQKARVAFARVQINNPTLLIFDEPTNHLDMESREALIEGINNFSGAVVIISHDIHVIKSLERIQLFVVGNSNIIEYKVGFDAYCGEIINSI